MQTRLSRLLVLILAAPLYWIFGWPAARLRAHRADRRLRARGHPLAPLRLLAYRAPRLERVA